MVLEIIAFIIQMLDGYKMTHVGIIQFLVSTFTLNSGCRYKRQEGALPLLFACSGENMCSLTRLLLRADKLLFLLIKFTVAERALVSPLTLGIGLLWTNPLSGLEKHPALLCEGRARVGYLSSFQPLPFVTLVTKNLERPTSQCPSLWECI